MTTLSPPACPTCGTELTLHADETFDTWVCPNGHGLAFTLSEAYERLRDDEIQAIWQRARSGDSVASGRRCPMCSQPMVAVRCETITLDVCVVDEVFWFDAGELDVLPPEEPEPPPSADEQAELARITRSFGDALTAGWDAEDAETLTGRLTSRLRRLRRASTTTP
jgi:Zn-finger nucleic acid-binding protein